MISCISCLQFQAYEDLNALMSWQLAGADFNVLNYDSRTPLHVAVSSELEDKVQFFIPLASHGHCRLPTADPDEAIENGSMEIIRLLKKAKTKLCNGNGYHTEHNWPRRETMWTGQWKLTLEGDSVNWLNQVTRLYLFPAVMISFNLYLMFSAMWYH